MSSKTSYVLVANEGAKNDFQMPSKQPAQNLRSHANTASSIKGWNILLECKQIGLWHLSRHGQRYPEDVDIDEINDNLSKFRDRVINECEGRTLLREMVADWTENGTLLFHSVQATSTWLCEKDRRALQAWAPKMKTENGYYLTPDGIRIMKQLGSRMKNRLDDLIAKLRSSPDRVMVKATNITRTIQSSSAYLDGLYGNWPNRPVLNVQPDVSDYLLKFPDLCEKYLEVCS